MIFFYVDFQDRMIWSTGYAGSYLEVKTGSLFVYIQKSQWDKQTVIFWWPWNVLWSQRCSSWWDLHFLTSSGIQLKTQKSSVWESVGLSRQSRMLSDQRFSNLLSKWKRLNEIKNNTGLGDQLLWHDGRCCARELGIQNSKKSQPTNVHNLTCLNHQSRWSATLTRWRMLCGRFLSTSSPSRHTSSAPSHRRRRRACLRFFFLHKILFGESQIIFFKMQGGKQQ